MNPIINALASELISSMMKGGGQSGALGMNAVQSSAGGGELIKMVVSMFLSPSAPASAPQAAAGIGAANNSISAGGIENLLAQFQKSGLDDAVASWLSTGPNKSISADKVVNALGVDQVSQFGQQAGMNQQDAASNLASILPELINKLSPDGKLDMNLVNGLLQAIK